MANRTIRTAKKRDAFLLALEDTANVTKACKKSRLARRSAYEWRDDDPDFARAWDEALERGTDALEDEAVRRATEGTLKPVFYKGQKCGSVREYSDTLLIFMLKARRPEKFKERTEQQHTGKDGGPILTATVTKEELAEAVRSVRDKF
ncbi:hypothetical protein Dsui_0192 [Azospira oryzae PS]|uniref:Terminase n=1 Tax=Azospira oryzae (strain ATCC BAA-33 / DSM 13638 / PS) TaxID=640081 RepID=G8QMN2_AZOOP|nr:hypothetical protein [Azospira oryzae]AEV24612.1 hypothetical protein Dsui_0192 [Azospira oryzae PS]